MAGLKFLYQAAVIASMIYLLWIAVDIQKQMLKGLIVSTKGTGCDCLTYFEAMACRWGEKQ